MKKIKAKTGSKWLWSLTSSRSTVIKLLNTIFVLVLLKQPIRSLYLIYAVFSLDVFFCTISKLQSIMIVGPDHENADLIVGPDHKIADLIVGPDHKNVDLIVGPDHKNADLIVGPDHKNVDLDIYLKC